MIEDGSPIRIENNSGTLSFRNQADDTDLTLPATTPTSHSDSVHSGATANLITALTPTFVNWTQNPGTAADFADELTTNVLTTNGIGAAGNNTVTYDLGSSKRCIVYVNIYNATTNTGFVEVSDDNTNWHTLLYKFNTEYDKAAAGKFRYIRLRIIGVITISQFRIRVYPIS